MRVPKRGQRNISLFILFLRFQPYLSILSLPLSLSLSSSANPSLLHILARPTPVRPAESDQRQRSARGGNGSNRRATAATEVFSSLLFSSSLIFFYSSTILLIRFLLKSILDFRFLLKLALDFCWNQPLIFALYKFDRTPFYLNVLFPNDGIAIKHVGFTLELPKYLNVS